MAITACSNLSSLFAMLDRPDKRLHAIAKSLAVEPNSWGYAAKGRHHMIFLLFSEAIKDYMTAIESSNGTIRTPHLMNREIVYSLNGEPARRKRNFSGGRKEWQIEEYKMEYWLELSKRQRPERRIKVKLPG